MKKKSIFIVAIWLLLCAFGVGLILREPSHCVLCNVPESDVPCLIDLHSGEICELRVYDETISYYNCMTETHVSVLEVLPHSYTVFSSASTPFSMSA